MGFAVLLAATTGFAAATTAVPLTISAPPASQSQLTANTAYTIQWAPSPASDTLTVVIVTCPTASVAAQYCTALVSFPGVVDTGSFVWNVTTSLADGALYRVVITSSASSISATSSGVFTIAPFLRTVSSMYVRRVTASVIYVNIYACIACVGGLRRKKTTLTAH